MASPTLRRRTSYRAVGRHARPSRHPFFTGIVIVLVALTMVTSGASAATIFFYGQNLPSVKDFQHRFQFQNTLILDRNSHKLYDLADAGKGRRIVEPLRQTTGTAAGYAKHGEYWLTGPQGHG